MEETCSKQGENRGRFYFLCRKGIKRQGDLWKAWENEKIIKLFVPRILNEVFKFPQNGEGGCEDVY
jgi:hypothetical protein